MGVEERRKFYRVESINLLNYIYYAENGQKAQQGMGRTLNISESGVLLETHISMQESRMLSLMIGLEDDLVVVIKGQVVFTMPNVDKRFESGIKFLELDEVSLKTLRAYIVAFRAFQNQI